MVIEQKEYGQAKGKKMKSYSKGGHIAAEKGEEAPKRTHALDHEGNGSMNYLSKMDSMESSDASKVKGHMYKDGRYDG